MYYSLGPGLGALVGGYVWVRWSARTMYRAFAAAVAGLALVRAARLARRAARRARAPPRGVT